MTVARKQLADLYTNLESIIALSANISSMRFQDNVHFIFQNTPGFPHPEVSQTTALQQSDDFLLITENLVKCHLALIQARKELTLIGVQYLAKEELI